MRMHEVVCKPSRYAWVALGLGGGLALTALWLAALPPVVQVLGTFGIGLALLSAWRQSRACLTLRLQADGTVDVWLAGDWRATQIEPASFVSAYLIVLRLQVDTQRLSQVLWPDSADADSLRRLRVSLRWASRTPPDTRDRAAD